MMEIPQGRTLADRVVIYAVLLVCMVGGAQLPKLF